MYRTLAIAIITLGAIGLPVDTSLAFGNGGEGHFGRPMVSVGFAARTSPAAVRRRRS